jgi:dTDP-4-dehydrorhamnose reductase
LDKKLWLIGNKGMLGTEFSLLLEKSGLSFIGTDREVDITDPSALRSFTEKRSIGWIINCAAYTAVDRAEDDAETCRRLNESGAANIAACAKSTGAYLVHISTDYVFDGRGIAAEGAQNPRPYREDDVTNPIGVYGLTKRDGEVAVLANNPCSYVIRTAWLYGRHGNNFVATMLRLMNERDEIKVVDDQRGSPTWTYNLAETVLDLIKSAAGKNIPFGIYHYSNEGNITWFDFAKEIFRQGREQGRIGRNCSIKPCTSDEYPAKVKRPAYSVLDKSKIKAALGVEIPAWDVSLQKFLQEQI